MTDTEFLTIALATVPTMRFNHVDHRLEEMKEMWRSELHRVEGVLDGRLKHLEDR